jgi:hypothetical protein
MRPQIDIKDLVSVVGDYYNSVSSRLEELTNKSFSRDVYGYAGDYKKPLSIHHIGFVIFLLAFDATVNNYVADYSKYRLRLLRNYLQCLGIRDDITHIIKKDGIGGYIIEQTFKIQ